VINDFEYPGGEQLFAQALPMAERLAALKRRAKQAGLPVLYVNDNYGKWQSDLGKLIEHCLQDGVRGQPVVERLLPDEDDYFVLKPKHSCFFATPLDLLLQHLHVRRLLVTGVASDQCVATTAVDARMRDYDVVIPADCIATYSAERNRRALRHFEEALCVPITAGPRIRLPAAR
jgi:nicotinamidase-related amidase